MGPGRGIERASKASNQESKALAILDLYVAFCGKLMTSNPNVGRYINTKVRQCVCVGVFPSPLSSPR